MVGLEIQPGVFDACHVGALATVWPSGGRHVMCPQEPVMSRLGTPERAREADE